MKKFKTTTAFKRVLAATLALTVCAPYMADGINGLHTSITAFAVSGNGQGSGYGYSDTSGHYDGIRDLGLRIYVYDPIADEIVKKKNGTKMIVDLVYQETFDDGTYAVTNEYGTIVNWKEGMLLKKKVYGATKYTTTKFGSASAIGNKYNSEINSILYDIVYKGTDHNGGSIGVEGTDFYNWMMKRDDWKQDVYGDAPGDASHYNCIRLIADCFKDISTVKDTDYIVVEPIVFMGNSTIDTWSSWVSNGCGGNLAASYSDSKNGAVVGNNFELRENDLSDSKITRTGMYAPSDSSNTIGSLTSSTSGLTKSVLDKWGYGIQLYSLDGMGLPGGDVINTYDIDDNPSTPSGAETPSSTDSKKTVTMDGHEVELQNSGTKRIIKVYMDAYVDRDDSPNVPDGVTGDTLNNSYWNTNKKYIAVEQKGIYETTSTTGDVVVQDEFDKSGYHVVGWETSGYDWKLSGDKITATGKTSWNGENWLSLAGKALQINDTLMSSNSGIDGARARYNVLGSADVAGRTGVVKTARGKKGTVEDANNTVNHKWDYTAKDGTIVGKYSGDETDGKPNDTQKVTLTEDEKTIYVLYVREKPWVETNGSIDPPDGGVTKKTKDTGSKTLYTWGVGDNTSKDEKNGGLNIVKVYGIIDSGDFHVSNIDTESAQNCTYDLHIAPSYGYTVSTHSDTKDYNWRLHSYIFTDADFSKASGYTASQWCDGDIKDTDVYNNIVAKGYLNGFDYKVLKEVTVPESSRESYKASIWTKPFFNGSGADSDHTNDTVFLLYLLDTVTEKKTGTVNIPESYLSKNFVLSEEQTANKVSTLRNEDKNGNFTLTSQLETNEELLAEHPFYYILPQLSSNYSLVPENGVISEYSRTTSPTDSTKWGLVRYARTLSELNDITQGGRHNITKGGATVRWYSEYDYDEDGNKKSKTKNFVKATIPYTLVDSTITEANSDQFIGYDLMVGQFFDETSYSRRSWWTRALTNDYSSIYKDIDKNQIYVYNYDSAGDLVSDYGLVRSDVHDRVITSDGGKAISLVGTPSACESYSTIEEANNAAKSSSRLVKLTGLDTDFTLYREGDYADIASWKYDLQNPYSAAAFYGQTAGNLFLASLGSDLNSIGVPTGNKFYTLSMYTDLMGEGAQKNSMYLNVGTTVNAGSNNGGIINPYGSGKTVWSKVSTSNDVTQSRRAANGNNELGTVNMFFTDKTKGEIGSFKENLAGTTASPASVSLGQKTQFGTFGIYTLSENWYKDHFRNGVWKPEDLEKYFKLDYSDGADNSHIVKVYHLGCAEDASAEEIADCIRNKYQYPNWKNSRENLIVLSDHEVTSGDKAGFPGAITKGILYRASVLFEDCGITFGKDKLLADEVVHFETSTKYKDTSWYVSPSREHWATTTGPDHSFACYYAKYLVDCGLMLGIPVTYDTYTGVETSVDGTKAPNTEPYRMSTDDGTVRSGQQIDKGSITFTPYIGMVGGTSQYTTIYKSFLAENEDRIKNATTDAAKQEIENELSYKTSKFLFPVLATQQRTLRIYDYAGIDYTVVKPTSNYSILGSSTDTAKKLTLSSSQWSTHARAASIGKGNVLPGGATLAITTGKDAVTAVYAETWTAYLTGAGINQIRATNPGAVPGLLVDDNHTATDAAVMTGDDLNGEINTAAFNQMLKSVKEKTTNGECVISYDSMTAMAMTQWGMPLVDKSVKTTCDTVIDTIVNRQKDYVKSLILGLESINIDQYVAPVPESSISRDKENLITSVDETKVAPVWKLENSLKLNDVDDSSILTKTDKDKATHKPINGQESKYYLRTETTDYSKVKFINDKFEINEDRTTASYGDMDTVAGENKFTFYTFFTDTHGNIAVRYTPEMSEEDFRGDTGIRYRAICSMVDELSADQIIYAAENASDGSLASYHTIDSGSIACPLGDVKTEIILRRNQTLDKMDAKWADVDNKIGIITNLYYALERNTGDDKECPWAISDGHWYNEAFDGVSYIEMRTAISTRFTNPYERNMVLDPETTPGAQFGGATGASVSKGDLFTAINYSQFRTRAYSQAYGYESGGKIAVRSDKPDNNKLKSYYDDFEAKIGSITVDVVDPTTGNTVQKDVDIMAPYLNELFVSDIFYIPNATVQDLR